MRTLKLGSKGKAVRELQTLLNRTPAVQRTGCLIIDGDFGKRTHQAVRVFQISQKLTNDGVVDDPVWESLYAVAQLIPDVPKPKPDPAYDDEYPPPQPGDPGLPYDPAPSPNRPPAPSWTPWGTVLKGVGVLAAIAALVAAMSG